MSIRANDGVEEAVDALTAAPAPAASKTEAALQQKIEKLGAEVERWKREAQDAKSLAATMASSADNAADSKAKELAKKNRDLTVQLEKAKTELSELRRAGHAASGAGPDAPKPSLAQIKAQAKVDKDAQDEISKLKRLHDECVSKMGKLESKLGIVAKEKSNLEAAILKEFGGNVDVRAIAEGKLHVRRDVFGENAILKAQVAELRGKMGAASSKEEQDGDAKVEESRGGLIYKQRYDSALKELEEKEKEIAELKTAANGAICRRTIAERELLKARKQVKLLVQKSAEDDRLVNVLKQELDKLNSGGQSSGLSDEVALLRRQNAQQAEQVDRQEQMIMALQSQAAQAPGNDGASSLRKIKSLEAQLMKANEKCALLEADIDAMHIDQGANNDDETP